MSVKIVRDKIQTFLANDKPEVLTIKGEWGIGKTYCWNKFSLDAKDSVVLEKYSYISLFGINSLETLRYAIF